MRITLSIHARLAIAALILFAAATFMVSSTTSDIVGMVMMRDLDRKMDIQIRILEKSIDEHGHLDRNKLHSLPELDTPPPGWGWQVASGPGHWEAGQQLTHQYLPDSQKNQIDNIQSLMGDREQGMIWHGRRRVSRMPWGPLSVTVIAPKAVIDNAVDGVAGIIAEAMLVVFGCLTVGAYFLVRLALRPLRVLAKEVAQVRNGELDFLPSPQPEETREVVNEVNALIARNAAGLAAARLNAANLAHAIKTPLSTLSLQLELHDADPKIMALVVDIAGRITHHLRRSRNGALALGQRATANMALVIGSLKNTLLMMCDGKGLDIAVQVNSNDVVAVDPEDLREILGNLMENAGRYARHQVVISTQPSQGRMLIVVEDDGPGIPEAGLLDVLKPGVRLDEISEGYGLGLSIARELAEMYGGSLMLSKSADYGGLKAMVELPQ